MAPGRSAPGQHGPPPAYRPDSPPHHHPHHHHQQQHVALRPPQQASLNAGPSSAGANGLHHILSPHHHHPSGPPPPPPSQQMLPPGPPGSVPNGFTSSVALAASSSNPADVRRGPAMPESLIRLAKANEDTWIAIGDLADRMGDLDASLNAYKHAVRHNRVSVEALTRIAAIARSREDLGEAIAHWQRVVEIQPDNGEVWSAMGHCFLMQDDLQKAYMAYQQALYFLPNPKDPKLWYGIGILYDRYGSLDHAEEAFTSTLNMDRSFEKADEIYFRLGIIYKQQQKYQESLECFQRILRSPPNPLATIDIWFQIGHVYEQMKDYPAAKNAYEHVLEDNPNHAKVLQQLGWLHHQPNTSFTSQDIAIQYLTRSLEADGSDAQSWYLLGRCFMAVTKYQKAYEAYQQAVYRDGRNPTFWCSIGVLYFQINQYRDALDAYSRAIRINPYISEVWFDLGSLYESCNNQISDAIDAYGRAADLDQNNPVIKQRLALLREAQRTGGALPAAPVPQDVHPTAYATVGPPTLLSAAASGAMNNNHNHGSGLAGAPSPAMRPGLHELGSSGRNDLPRMSSVERDIRGPGSMDGVEMQRRDMRGGDRMHPDDRDREQHNRSRGPRASGQLSAMEIDKPYPGMGTGAGGLNGTIPSVRPESRESGPPGSNGNGVALHHPQPQPVLSPISHQSANGESRGHPHAQQQQPPQARGGLPPPPLAMQPGRRSPLSDRHPSPLPRGGNGRPGGPSNGGFSNQLPPPPSTLVQNAPSSYYPPYSESNGSRSPSDREGPMDPSRRESWRGAPPSDREREREYDRGGMRDGRDRRRDREMSPPSHSRRPNVPPGQPYYDEREHHRGGPGGVPSSQQRYDPRMGSPPPQRRDEFYGRRSPPPPVDHRRGYDRAASPPYGGPPQHAHQQAMEDPRYHQQFEREQEREREREAAYRERERERERDRDQGPPARKYDPRMDSQGPAPPPPPQSSSSQRPRQPEWERPQPPLQQQQQPPYSPPELRRVSSTATSTSAGVELPSVMRHESESPAPGGGRPMQQQQQMTLPPMVDGTPSSGKERKKRGPKEDKAKDNKGGRKSMGGATPVPGSSSRRREDSISASGSAASPDSVAHPDPVPTPTPSQGGGGGVPRRGESGTPAPRGGKKDSPGASSFRGQRSAVSSPQERPEVIPRREVDEDYDDAAVAVSSLMDFASSSSRPSQPAAVHAPTPIPASERPQHGRQNSIAALISPTAGSGPSSANETRNATPKRARPSSPDASSKRTRIEILNAPTISAAALSSSSSQPPPPQAQAPSSQQPPSARTPSPSVPARRLTPIHMASRAPSDSRFRSSSSSSGTPPPASASATQGGPSSPKDRKVLAKSPSPIAAARSPGSHKSPPSPVRSKSDKGDDSMVDGAGAGAVPTAAGSSEMQLDSRHASPVVKRSGSTTFSSVPGEKPAEADAMAVDAPAKEGVAAASG